MNYNGGLFKIKKVITKDFVFSIFNFIYILFYKDNKEI